MKKNIVKKVLSVSFASVIVINLLLLTRVINATQVIDPRQDGAYVYWEKYNNYRCEPTLLSVNCNGLWNWKN